MISKNSGLSSNLHLIGIRVSPKVEDFGLDISEHAESVYSDEEESC